MNGPGVEYSGAIVNRRVLASPVPAGRQYQAIQRITKHAGGITPAPRPRVELAHRLRENATPERLEAATAQQ